MITGHQWWWEARYPNGVVATWDIHIPTSRRLRARIESTDVIHDFWAPELARKMDAVPGHWSYIWLEADAPGTYAGTCSEFCGAQHAWMRFRVIAEGEVSFNAWLQHQAQPSPEPSGIAVEGRGCFNRRDARSVIVWRELARFRQKDRTWRTWPAARRWAAALRATHRRTWNFG